MDLFSLLPRCNFHIQDINFSEEDILLSTYTHAQRIQLIGNKFDLSQVHWLLASEYGISSEECSSGFVAGDAENSLNPYLKKAVETKKNIVIDSTGFIRPHLLYTLRYLQNKVDKIDIIYSEPHEYKDQEKTKFSAGLIDEPKAVRGLHSPLVRGAQEIVIIGAGYDTKLIRKVAAFRPNAKLVGVTGLPSLKAEMYQENTICLNSISSDCNWNKIIKAPAYDPFYITSELQNYVSSLERNISQQVNVFLAPLSTKPIVIGFSLFEFIRRNQERHCSIIYPFTKSYDKATSNGIGRVWKYTVDFKLFQKLAKKMKESRFVNL